MTEIPKYILAMQEHAVNANTAHISTLLSRNRHVTRPTHRIVWAPTVWMLAATLGAADSVTVNTDNSVVFGVDPGGTKSFRLGAGGGIQLGTRALSQDTYFGYGQGYRAIMFGSTSTDWSAPTIGAVTFSLGVDPSVITGGNGFTGQGNELIVRRNFRIITPNAAGTDWVSPIRFSSDAVLVGTSDVVGAEALRVSGSAKISDSLVVNSTGNLGVKVDIASAVGRYGLGFFSNAGRATTGVACNTSYGAASVSLGGWDGSVFTEYLRTGPSTGGAVVVGNDPGGPEQLRVAGSMRVGGGVIAMAPSYLVGPAGGVATEATHGLRVGSLGAPNRYIAVGYDSQTDRGYIAPIHSGTMWKSLGLCPIAGEVIVGGDPGGTERFRVGGSVRTGGLVSVAAGANATFDSGSINDARLEFKRNGVRQGLLSWDASVVRLEGDVTTSSSIVLKTAGVDRMRISPAGDVAVGTDPGGSELLRVGGSVNLATGNALKIAGANRVAGTTTGTNLYCGTQSLAVFSADGAAQHVAVANSTGNVTITSAATSTSTTTGALTVAGGLGINGATNFGSTLTAYGPIAVTSGTSTAGGMWRAAADGLNIRGATGTVYDLTLQSANGLTNVISVPTGTSNVVLGSTASSSSPSTGALVVPGGVGVAGTAYIGGEVHTGSAAYVKARDITTSGITQLTATDEVVRYANTTAAGTFILPPLSSPTTDGRRLFIKNKIGSGTLTIQRNGSNLLDGQTATKTMAANAAGMVFVAIGNDWATY